MKIYCCESAIKELHTVEELLLGNYGQRITGGVGDFYRKYCRALFIWHGRIIVCAPSKKLPKKYCRALFIWHGRITICVPLNKLPSKNHVYLKNYCVEDLKLTICLEKLKLLEHYHNQETLFTACTVQLSF
jgi:hypothetical protein